MPAPFLTLRTRAQSASAPGKAGSDFFFFHFSWYLFFPFLGDLREELLSGEASSGARLNDRALSGCRSSARSTMELPSLPRRLLLYPTLPLELNLSPLFIDKLELSPLMFRIMSLAFRPRPRSMSSSEPESFPALEIRSRRDGSGIKLSNFGCDFLIRKRLDLLLCFFGLDLSTLLLT